MKPPVRLFTAAMLACAAVPASHAQDAQRLQARTLAASCAACHGTAGKPVQGSAVPGLAGMPAADLAARMRAFKTGAPATVMHQISKGYSDAQIDQLAAYFAAQTQ
jgi:cytochrome c553